MEVRRRGGGAGGAVVQVADGVFWACSGPLVNWYLLVAGRDVVLVDAGYPGDATDVAASIARVGRHPGDVRAVLVTHAHADHLGAVGPLHAAHGTPVFTSGPDAGPARCGVLEQVGVATVLAHAWWPGVLPWAVRAVRRGGTRVAPAPHVQPFPGAGPSGQLDLPGGPVPVATVGHTAGHTAFHLPSTGVVLTGDALVTGHPTSSRTGPQLLPAFFDADRASARRALQVLAVLDADLVLPGHGRPHRGPVAAAAEQAAAPQSVRAGDRSSRSGPAG